MWILMFIWLISCISFEERVICATGSNDTRDAQCMRCNKDRGCIKFEDLSKVDFYNVDKFCIINNTNIEFAFGKTIISYQSSSGTIQYLYKKLVIYFFTDRANVTITQRSTNGNQVTAIESKSDIIFRFNSIIKNLPIDVATNKNVLIAISASVNINGGFSIAAGYNISFRNINDKTTTVLFNVSYIVLAEQSSITFSSAPYFVMFLFDLFIPPNSPPNDLPIYYSLSSEGISYVIIKRLNQNIFYGNKINFRIIPYQITSSTINTLKMLGNMPCLKISNLLNTTTFTFSLELPKNPGFFGFWDKTSIVKMRNIDGIFYIYLDTEEGLKYKNNLCYSLNLDCPPDFTNVASANVADFIEIYVPFYTIELNIYLLSNLPQDYIPLSELPPEAKINIYGEDRAAFSPMIYMCSIGTSENSTFSFRNVWLVVNDICGPFTMDSPFMAINCKLTLEYKTEITFTNIIFVSFDFFRKLPPHSLDQIKCFTLCNCTSDLTNVDYDGQFFKISYLTDSNSPNTIYISNSVNNLIFDLLDNALLAISTSFQAKENKKHGIKIMGSGKITFEEDYDHFTSDLYPIEILNGRIGIILFSGNMPNFIVHPSATPYYTMPNQFSGDIISNISNLDIPVQTGLVYFTDDSSISANSDINIFSLVVTDNAYIKLTNTNVQNTLIMKRGTAIRAVESVNINDGINIFFDWRIKAIPKIRLNTTKETVPSKFIITLDIQDPKYIDIDAYIDYYYMIPILLVEGIPTSVCPKWIKKAHFKSVVEFFDDSNCSISLICQKQNNTKADLSDIMFFFDKSIPRMLPQPTESPTPMSLKANANIVTSAVVVIYAVAAIVMIGLFYNLKKKIFLENIDESTQSDHPDINGIDTSEDYTSSSSSDSSSS